MFFNRVSYKTLVLLAVSILVRLATGVDVQGSELGEVKFPTSTESKEAQAHFLRGVAALHSFWYPVALDEFRQSTRIEPGFMMGYWGEAMAHNHPVWGDPQETEAAREVLLKIKDKPTLTPREKAYLGAVKILFGAGDNKGARDRAYAEAMEKIYQEYSGDLEAASFYALALLGTIRPDDPAALRTRMLAAAIAEEVYRKEPSHPGAVHYILHAFDDPDHAILALPAARRYAEIAPEAPHALHMPSHIFLQLGMWPETAASNEDSWAASTKWVEQKNLPISKRDYHSLHWLLYAYLQQGRYGEAEKQLTLMQKSLTEGPKDDQFFMGYGTFIYASMAAALVVETERWGMAEKLFETLQKNPALTSLAGKPGSYRSLAQYILALGIFTRGLAAAHEGLPGAQKSIDDLQAMEEQVGKETLPSVGVSLSKVLEIQRLEIAAVSNAAKGKMDESIKNMEKATALEESVLPPPGPPPLIKPSHELFGEILLQSKRPREAEEQFKTALLRQPNRARSLLGIARAAARRGDLEDAAAAYSKFLLQWQKADTHLPELHEAHKLSKLANARWVLPHYESQLRRQK